MNDYGSHAPPKRCQDQSRIGKDVVSEFGVVDYLAAASGVLELDGMAKRTETSVSSLSRSSER